MNSSREFNLPSESSPSDSTALIQQSWIAGVRAGDDRAFETMFRAYRDDLVAFAESLLRSHEAAQEIVQDLFLRIWQMRDLWEPRGPLNAYLYRATRNRAIMRLRGLRVANADNRLDGKGATWEFRGGGEAFLARDGLTNARVLRFSFDGGIPEKPEDYFTPHLEVYASSAQKKSGDE